jgi:hypothetical protein
MRNRPEGFLTRFEVQNQNRGVDALLHDKKLTRIGLDDRQGRKQTVKTEGMPILRTHGLLCLACRQGVGKPKGPHYYPTGQRHESG